MVDGEVVPCVDHPNGAADWSDSQQEKGSSDVVL